MSDAPEKDQKTEAPTDKRRREAAEKGDVLQSKELAIALVMVSGAAWIALGGKILLSSLAGMLTQGLTFDAAAIRDFNPASAAFHLLGLVLLPLFSLFAAGLSIALPVGFAIILVQLVMAMLARSAPQLNLFSVGLPAALLAGIVLLAMAAPVMSDGIIAVIQQGLEQSRRLALG